MAWPAGAARTQHPSLASYQTLSRWTDALALLLPPRPELNDLAGERCALFYLTLFRKVHKRGFFFFFFSFFLGKKIKRNVQRTKLYFQFYFCI